VNADVGGAVEALPRVDDAGKSSARERLRMNTTTAGRATIETNSKRQVMATPIQYLDKAMTPLRDLGLVPEKTEEAPIVAPLNRVSDLTH
jgi:hypothetical protein